MGSVTGCTFSGNSTTGNGGAIQLPSNTNQMMTITATTIIGNTGMGGGIGISGGTLTLTDSIVANNTLAGGEASDIVLAGGTLDDGGFNLIGDAANAAGLMDGVNNDIVGHDPMLAPLGDYGGPVQTFALLPGSPAIDAGTGTDPDARGVDPVGQKDIGSFESQGFTFTDSTGPGSPPRSIPPSAIVDRHSHRQRPRRTGRGWRHHVQRPASGASATLSASRDHPTPAASSRWTPTANGTPAVTT